MKNNELKEINVRNIVPFAMIAKKSGVLTVKEIYKLGYLIAEKFNNLNKRNILLVSNVYIKQFIREYDDFFMLDKNEEYIILKENKTIADVVDIAANSSIDYIVHMSKIADDFYGKHEERSL